MKIAFVFDDSLDYPDGVQQYMLTLGRWYKKEGHEVHYIVSTTKRTDLENVHNLVRNVGVSFNGNHLRTPLIARKRQIKKLFRKHTFDVLHVQMPYSPLFVSRVIAYAPSTTKIVGTFHIAPYGKMTQILATLHKLTIRKTLKKFDSICSVSKAAQTFARDTFGLTSQIIPNAVTLNHFKQPIRAYSHHEETVTIAFLGRLVERKGCIWLLRAINELIEQDRRFTGSIKVKIGGSGAQAAQLQDYVMQNDLANIVEFVGFVPENEKPSFLASADIAVFPSLGGESFGIILVEAMATGQSVVLAGDNPGYNKVMEGSEHNIFNPKNIESLTALLKRYIDGPKKRQDRIAWQLNIIKQYDVEVVGKRLLQLYAKR